MYTLWRQLGRTWFVLAEQTLASEHRRIDHDDGSNLQIRLSGLIWHGFAAVTPSLSR